MEKKAKEILNISLEERKLWSKEKFIDQTSFYMKKLDKALVNGNTNEMSKQIENINRIYKEYFERSCELYSLLCSSIPETEEELP